MEEIAYNLILEKTDSKTVSVAVSVCYFFERSSVSGIYLNFGRVVIEVIPKRALHQSDLKSRKSVDRHSERVMQNFTVYLLFEVYGQTKDILAFFAHEHRINFCRIIQFAPSLQRFCHDVLISGFCCIHYNIPVCSIAIS